MRASLPALCLTASLAFGSAFAMARRWRPQVVSGACQPTTGPAPPSILGSRDAADGSDPTQNTTNGVIRDPLLRESLGAGDLASAVAVIMAHEHEDHCADTRLICLVENLPSHRLAELPAVLNANEANDFIVRHLLTAWAQRDGLAAHGWLQSRPGSSEALLHACLLGWTRGAPGAALAWLDEQPISSRTGVMQTALLEAMAERDPSAAFDLMKERRWLDHSPSAVIRLLQNWGGADPAAGLAGLREVSEAIGLRMDIQGGDIIGDPVSHQQSFRVMLGALLHGAFQRSPAEASALIARLSPAELVNGANAIHEEVLARDPAAEHPKWPPGASPLKPR